MNNCSKLLLVSLFMLQYQTTEEELIEKIDKMKKLISHQEQEMDLQWVKFCSYLRILLMIGLAMLLSGKVRIKNSVNMLISIPINIVVSIIVWFLLGQGFTHGETFMGIVGLSEFAGFSDDYKSKMLLQWSNPVLVSSVITGCLAERIKLNGQIIITIMITGFIYPIAAHWVQYGWLKDLGMVDQAGAGAVHLLAGLCGLIGTILVGPRKGRFGDQPDDFNPHNMPLSAFGGILIWLGFQSLNAGAVAKSSGIYNHIVQMAVFNSTMAAGAGGITAFIVTLMIDGIESINSMINGILVGLVTVSANCDQSNPYLSIFLATIGGIIQTLTAKWIQQRGVDDPMDFFSVFGVGGIWSLVSTPIVWNLLYGGNVSMFMSNLIGAAVIVLWVILTFLPLIQILNSAGLLRVSDEVELKGMDETYHGGFGYIITESKEIGGEPIPDDPNNI